MIKITGKVVELRQVSTDEEKLKMLQWRNSDRIRVNMYNDELISEEAHYAWLDKTLNDSSKQYFIIYDALKNEPVGLVNLMGINNELSHAEWAFYIGEEGCLNTGHAVEVEALLLEYVFEELKLHRLFCAVLDFNKQVISFHLKFGFVQEGQYRQYLYRDGRWVDVILLAILEDEYKAAKDKTRKLVDVICRKIIKANRS